MAWTDAAREASAAVRAGHSVQGGAVKAHPVTARSRNGGRMKYDPHGDAIRFANANQGRNADGIKNSSWRSETASAHRGRK